MANMIKMISSRKWTITILWDSVWSNTDKQQHDKSKKNDIRYDNKKLPHSGCCQNKKLVIFIFYRKTCKPVKNKQINIAPNNMLQNQTRQVFTFAKQHNSEPFIKSKAPHPIYSQEPKHAHDPISLNTVQQPPKLNCDILTTMPKSYCITRPQCVTIYRQKCYKIPFQFSPRRQEDVACWKIETGNPYL